MRIETKTLTAAEANKYLKNVGMTLGNWNDVRELESAADAVWFNYKAPKEAGELLTFSQHVAGWIPGCEWMLIQIDNSSDPRFDEMDWIAKLLSLPEPSSAQHPVSFLSEMGSTSRWMPEGLLLASQIIFCSLLFEWHVYIVGSHRPSKEYLNLHDGFVYFHGIPESILRAQQMAMRVRAKPRLSASWVALQAAAEQERNFRD